ncbi:MAG: TonB family protein [Pyrinomonadaceae bacterium]
MAQALPASGAAERQRGIDLYRQGQFTEAAKLLREVVNTNGTDEQSWYYLGLALLQNPKEIKLASQAFETAIKLTPNFAAAHAGLSYAFLKRDKFSDALREAQAALKIDSRIANAHHIIAVIRLNAGADEEALKEAREAIRLNQNLAAAYLVKSEALLSIYADDVWDASRSYKAPAKPPPPLTREEQAKRRQKRKQDLAPLTEAAQSLEVYLRMNPSDPANERRREQLANLRVFMDPDGGQTNSERISFGFEVTTKARVLDKPEPEYTEEARSARVRGTVVLQGVFGADGKLRNILIIKALPHGLTESAIMAARSIRFTPATIDGKPVSMFIQLEYNFNL